MTSQDVFELAQVVYAGEQAALRRLAALAGAGDPPAVFAAIADEIASIVDFKRGVRERATAAAVIRFEPDESLSIAAYWGERDPRETRTRWPLRGDSVTARIWRTARSARMDDYSRASGGISAEARAQGFRSAVGVPIVVDERLWGAAVAFAGRPEAFADGTEERMTEFAKLAAIAIANAEVRTEAERLAAEQAALRHVATLVARGVASAELFAAVAEAVGQLLGADLSALIRYEPGEQLMVVANWSADGDPEPAGGRWPLPGSLAERVKASGRPGRVDNWHDVHHPVASYVHTRMGALTSVGSPIFVDGRLWGAIMTHMRTPEPFGADAEQRIGSFAELVATAVSNAQARAEAQRLADEQAALRRVATIVARQPSSQDVFDAVVMEVGRLLGVEIARLMRFGAGDAGRFVAAWGELGTFPSGSEVSTEGMSVAALVRATGRAARFDDYERAPGQLAARIHEGGISVSVGSPVVVAGRMWGTLIAASRRRELLPPGTESRIEEFSELASTAISNMQARSDLAASRARIVVATDQARRRFERDLHDGAQQRLVSLALGLRGAEAMTPPRPVDLRDRVRGVVDGLGGVLDDLRELSRGIHPAILSEGGLAPALWALARRSAVPVDLLVELDDPLDERVEVAAYYVVSEALANAAKHAHAAQAVVRADAAEGLLRLTVSDDGAGGAEPADGSGLAGLVDRVEALGGTMTVASPAGAGTTIAVTLPVAVEIG